MSLVRETAGPREAGGGNVGVGELAGRFEKLKVLTIPTSRAAVHPTKHPGEVDPMHADSICHVGHARRIRPAPGQKRLRLCQPFRRECIARWRAACKMQSQQLVHVALDLGLRTFAAALKRAVDAETNRSKPSFVDPRIVIGSQGGRAVLVGEISFGPDVQQPCAVRAEAIAVPHPCRLEHDPAGVCEVALVFELLLQASREDDADVGVSMCVNADRSARLVRNFVER